jgi:hypothetical protein
VICSAVDRGVTLFDTGGSKGRVPPSPGRAHSQYRDTLYEKGCRPIKFPSYYTKYEKYGMIQ